MAPRRRGQGWRLLDLRDRSLLLLGFAGAFRRSELVSLDHGDLEFSRAGVVVRLRRSKTDQEGEGRRIGVPRGQHAETCPVIAIHPYLKSAGIGSGPLFRPVSRHGQLVGRRLSDRAVVSPQGWVLGRRGSHWSRRGRGRSRSSPLVQICARGTEVQTHATCRPYPTAPAPLTGTPARWLVASAKRPARGVPQQRTASWRSAAGRTHEEVEVGLDVQQTPAQGRARAYPPAPAQEAAALARTEQALRAQADELPGLGSTHADG